MGRPWVGSRRDRRRRGGAAALHQHQASENIVTMAVCAPAAVILMIARPVLMLAGISNHLSARTAAVQRGLPPRRRRLRRDPTHGRPIRRWGSSDRTNQPSSVPERRPARSSADRTRPLKPQGPCWPSAAQKRLLRYPCGSRMHGARMVAAIGRASIMAHENAWGARWGRRTKDD